MKSPAALLVLAFFSVCAFIAIGAEPASLSQAPLPASPAASTEKTRAPPQPGKPASGPAPKLATPEDLLAKFPAVTVASRKEKMDGYPCSECHDDSLPPDPKERELTEAHDDIKLMHGGGRFWCTTCHGADKGTLVSLKGQPIDFDQSYLLCGQCHFKQQREFFFGAHGKRLESWRGERKVAACTSCHDAHDPAVKPRKPWRGPDATR